MSSRASVPEPEADRGASAAVCTILAGPNGSGKSSIFDLLQPVGEFVNADVIARSAGAGNTQAARLAILRLDAVLQAREDFVFETTLSSHHAIALMRRARNLGYEIGLVFVALASADLNVRRVAERVSRGGHHIPEDDIRRRYPRAFGNLAKAIPLAHGVLIYDNSERVPKLLLRIARGAIEANHLDAGRTHHVLIAEATAEALDLGPDAVFATGRQI
ncbi:zeta toxin family protein [Methylobacterium sp. JK268]